MCICTHTLITSGTLFHRLSGWQTPIGWDPSVLNHTASPDDKNEQWLFILSQTRKPSHSQTSLMSLGTICCKRVIIIQDAKITRLVLLTMFWFYLMLLTSKPGVFDAIEDANQPASWSIMRQMVMPSLPCLLLQSKEPHY